MKNLLKVALVGACLTAAGNATADLALATASGCTACHQVDAKVVGPAYKEVAAKYKADPEAQAKLTKAVIDGGVGVWGEIPMLPKGGRADVSDDDIAKLVAWILTL